MEEFSGELKRAGLQKETLFRAWEQAQSQASSVLAFALQWQDLEERFDGIRASLERRAEELREGERSLAEREDGLRRSARRRAEGREEEEEEARRKEAGLRAVEERLEECRDERRKEESELVLKRGALGECDALIRDKEAELRSLMQAAEECRGDCELKKGQVEVLRQELDLKEKKVGSVEAKLEEVSKSLELKSRELDSVRSSIDDHNLKLASKKRELESVQINITQCAEQLRLKEQEYVSKKKQCDSMQKSITECSQELEFKTRQLDSIQWRSRECLADLERKEEQLYMLNMSIGECSRIVEMRKEECDVQCMELELGRQRLYSIEKSIEGYSREMESRERIRVHSGVMAQNRKRPLTNGPVLASCLNSQPTFAFDGKDLQMFLCRHFQEHDRVCHEVLEMIEKSADAAKLVLDAMEGFYPQNSGNRDGLTDIGVIRRSCIFLLEILMQFSVKIKPQQRVAAMKLAVEWKGKLKFSPSPEHHLEVLGFLNLLEAYQLASAFDANEIQDLANFVSQFQKAQELHQDLGSSVVRPVKQRCNY